MHPFPSLLDGLVTAALVLLAGGSVVVAMRLGVAMLALQSAIGTANDLVDEPVDRGRKAGKPLPRGLLSRDAARVLFGGALLLGLGLSALSGGAVLAVALAGTAVGLLYDARLKGTIWSWLPFAVGIPLLPVYAWLGAAGHLPPPFLILLPAAVLAGAALAIANVLADADRDAQAGMDTVATRLGVDRAWLVSGVLYLIVLGIAVVSLVALGGRGAGILVVAAGSLIVGAGLLAGRRGPSARRERAWEVQAGGIGLVAAGWVAAVVAASAL